MNEYICEVHKTKMENRWVCQLCRMDDFIKYDKKKIDDIINLYDANTIFKYLIKYYKECEYSTREETETALINMCKQ